MNIYVYVSADLEYGFPREFEHEVKDLNANVLILKSKDRKRKVLLICHVCNMLGTSTSLQALTHGSQRPCLLVRKITPIEELNGQKLSEQDENDRNLYGVNDSWEIQRYEWKCFTQSDMGDRQSIIDSIKESYVDIISELRKSKDVIKTTYRDLADDRVSIKDEELKELRAELKETSLEAVRSEMDGLKEIRGFIRNVLRSRNVQVKKFK